MNKVPTPPTPSSGAVSAVPELDQVIVIWVQWNRFGGQARTSGREAMALIALLARDSFVRELAVYSISPMTDRADKTLYRANFTALRAHRGEGE